MPKERLRSLAIREPHRLFFPLAFVFLILGLAPWSLRGFAPSLSHPETFHVLMLGHGFLFSIASGVWLTGEARRQGAPPSGAGNVWALWIALLGLAAAGAFRLAASAYAFQAASLAILAGLAARRMRTAPDSPPAPAFLLAAAATCLPFSLLGLAGALGRVPAVLGRTTVEAGFQGFFLLFAAGCARWERIPGGPPPRSRAWVAFAALVLATSMAGELASVLSVRPGKAQGVAYLLRFVAAGWFLVPARGLRSMLAGDPRFDKPYRAGYALALLGLLLAADFPGRAPDLLHVAYLPGFAWMAVVAATATSLRGTERGSARGAAGRASPGPTARRGP